MNTPLRPMVLAWHRGPKNRYETDPMQELMRFENRERAFQQSKDTKDNRLGALPKRQSLR